MSVLHYRRRSGYTSLNPVCLRLYSCLSFLQDRGRGGYELKPCLVSVCVSVSVCPPLSRTRSLRTRPYLSPSVFPRLSACRIEDVSLYSRTRKEMYSLSKRAMYRMSKREMYSRSRKAMYSRSDGGALALWVKRAREWKEKGEAAAFGDAVGPRRSSDFLKEMKPGTDAWSSNARSRWVWFIQPLLVCTGLRCTH